MTSPNAVAFALIFTLAAVSYFWGAREFFGVEGAHSVPGWVFLALGILMAYVAACAVGNLY